MGITPHTPHSNRTCAINAYGLTLHFNLNLPLAISSHQSSIISAFPENNNKKRNNFLAGSPRLQFPLPFQEQKGFACEFHNVRYSPSSFSNCSWVPACTIRPCSRTITLSAMETAPRRWVIMIPVFPSNSLRKVSYMAFSLKGPIAEVASSRIRKSASL